MVSSCTGLATADFLLVYKRLLAVGIVGLGTGTLLDSFCYFLGVYNSFKLKRFCKNLDI